MAGGNFLVKGAPLRPLGLLDTPAFEHRGESETLRILLSVLAVLAELLFFRLARAKGIIQKRRSYGGNEKHRKSYRRGTDKHPYTELVTTDRSKKKKIIIRINYHNNIINFTPKGSYFSLG